MRYLKYMGLIVAGAILSGAFYQWVWETSDESLIPGDMVVVDGHRFHLLCKGQGKPLVILENGLWGSYPDWFYILDGISRTTRVCAYDRLGIGWSSENNRPTRASDVAGYLHQLRKAADLDEPMILVGFSAGGLYAREYYRQYPDDVVGMLLVDSTHEQQANRIMFIPKDLSLERFCTAIAWTGVGRIFGLFDDYPEKSFTPVQHEEQLRAYHRTGFCAGLIKQSVGFEQDLQAGMTPPALGDLPLVVIAAGKSIREQVSPGGWPEQFLAEHESTWPVLQEELAGLSTDSVFIVAEGSGHAVQLERPELVIGALQELIRKVRSH